MGASKRNLLFNGQENLAFEDEFKEELSAEHHMGVYFPQKDSVLNYINVLENYFFDYNATATTNEDVPEMEYEQGVVY